MLNIKFNYSVKEKISDFVVKHSPDKVLQKKGRNFVKFVGDNISSPEQRLILGVTGLAIQPFIDLKTKQISDDTRSISVARTLAKNIAGTFVGFGVRALTIYATKKFSNMKPLANSIGTYVRATKKDFLAPKIIKDYSRLSHDNYINALGTIIGTVVMLYTNFILDAPLTMYLTNKFSGEIKKVGEKQ